MERLARDGSVAVSALSHGLGVSEASVRRDLSFLEAQRWLSRTHGGAVVRSLPAGLSVPSAAPQRQAERFEIGRLAAARVPDGARVGLAAGALSVAVARAIAERESLTVVTNQLDAAHELSSRDGVTVLVTGGVAASGSPVLTGPLVESSLREVHLDLVIIGGDGVSPEAGLTADDVLVAHAARVFKEVSRRAVAVFDAPRVGHTAFARICPLTDVAELLTADDLDPELRGRIEEAGVRVVTE
jgi:DeoR family transcriptional regulator of aga operon